MRPTTSTMLQQNNNNNYPCLNMSGSTQEMLQRCSRAALPFPSRLELGDLPLIRGLRAWALCSKNRRKAGGLLGGRQASTAPHGGRGNLTSCSKPAGVYLSGECGRMKYGLPLALDARQAEIGALVTVATLKTSEGSGKTQTQCLFLQTEKGSCLYSTAKPGSGGTSSAGSSVVGGWLRGKTGGGRGGRDTSVGRRDGGPNLPAQTGAIRVRVGSGRRWRKSGNATGREKPAVSRERRHRSREDPAAELTLEERKEVQDKGALDSKRAPSPQQDSKKGRQEKERVCRAPRCCHNTSPKTCTRCTRRAQREESQEEHEGGESPSSAKKGVRKEGEREKEEGDVLELGLPNVASAAPRPDLESNDGYDELKRHSKDDTSEEEQDTNSDSVVDGHAGNNDFVLGPSETLTDDFKLSPDKRLSDGIPAENPCEELVACVNGLSDRVESNQEFEKEMEAADVKAEERSVSQTLVASTAASSCSIHTGGLPDSSSPTEGSVRTAELAARGVRRENSEEERLEEFRTCEEDHERLEVGRREPCDGNNTVKFIKNGKPLFDGNETSSSPLRHDVSTTATGERSDRQTAERERRHKLVSEEDNLGTRLNPENEAEDILTREHTSDAEERCTKDGMNRGVIQEDNCGVKRNCAAPDSRQFQGSAGGGREEKEEAGDTCSQTSNSHVHASGGTGSHVTDPFTSPANPAPPLPPPGSMATGPPCAAVEEEEEEEEGKEEGDDKGARVTPRGREGARGGTRRHGGALEQQGEGGWGPTVASGDARKELEEGEEDEFGVFVQADGELAWSEGFTMSAPVPSGSRESAGDAVTAGSWTDGPSPQEDGTWTAFSLDPSAGSAGAAGQWWPTSAVEQRTGAAKAVSVFAEAFPSPPADTSDLDAVPTLTQLLRARASQDQGLLDSFHDLNRMIGQRHKRASCASRDLLLRTLHVVQPQTESRPANWRLSPGLPSANQHAHSVAAKRRLSYDYNRNVME